MTNLETLLADAKAGKLNACQECPWNPQFSDSMAFGVSCLCHGFDYRSTGDALSIQIAQDPAGSSPGETGRLCFVCNSPNRTDMTARNARELWEAAVSCGPYNRDGGGHLRHHFVTNAIMHGPHKGVPASDADRKRARVRCSSVLAGQIEMLRPKVVIACGVYAANSLREIGLLEARWDEFKERLMAGAYSEKDKSWRGFGTSIYCTYHTSKRGVDHAAARYEGSHTDEVLDKRLTKLGDQTEASAFAERHSGQSKRDRGMRVLLLHWLDIGEAIRRAHKFEGATRK
jgi:hypothetical protein